MDVKTVPSSKNQWLATSAPTKSTMKCQLATTVPSVLSTSDKKVTVGADGKLRFDPIEMIANIGDVIEFNFLALNHTLTQSTLGHPCQSNGQLNTGFNQFNPQNEAGKFIVKHTITTLSPQWFFCAQIKPKSHCQAGMVFAINPGVGLEAFISVATNTASELPATTSSLGSDQDRASLLTMTNSFEATIAGQQTSSTARISPSPSGNVTLATPTPSLAIARASIQTGSNGMLFSLIATTVTFFLVI